VTASPSGVVSCSGAPRDLGIDQGRVTRAAVRAAASDLPLGARIGFQSARARQCARDAVHHFPHMSERLAGLARGAGVPRSTLGALLARELDGGAGTAAVLLSERTGAGPLLARTLPAPGAWIVRRSAPEHDWTSIEVAQPWLVPAFAGVNRAGLAVAAIVASPAPGSCIANSAPALLLAQDCLQRWDSVQKAIEWCERRPCGGTASLLLVDGEGDAVEIQVRGAERALRRASGGVLVCAADAARAEDLAKGLAGERSALAPTALAEAVGRGAACAVLDPVARTLAIGGTLWPAAVGSDA
jgi:hypothetical protein